MEIFIFYLFLSVIVGIAAQQRRNRNGVGWFVLSLLISPLLAGLLVLAMQSRAPRAPYRVVDGRIVRRVPMF
jgi:biotin transporter BioY